MAYYTLSVLSLLTVAAILPGSAVKTGTGHSQLLPRHAESTNEPSVTLVAARSTAILRPNYAATALNLRHWNQTTVTVRVIAQPGDRRRSELQTAALISRAMGLWNERIGNTITLKFAEDTEDADVQINFVQPRTLAGGAIGRTDVTFRLSDQVLTHANVRLNLGLSNEQLVQVAAHELGHALGIEGHSDDPHDLMYTYAHVPAAITERDLNTMAMSYKTSFDGRQIAATADVDAHPVASSASVAMNHTDGANDVH